MVLVKKKMDWLLLRTTTWNQTSSLSKVKKQVRSRSPAVKAAALSQPSSLGANLLNISWSSVQRSFDELHKYRTPSDQQFIKLDKPLPERKKPQSPDAHVKLSGCLQVCPHHLSRWTQAFPYGLKLKTELS